MWPKDHNASSISSFRQMDNMRAETLQKMIPHLTDCLKVFLTVKKNDRKKNADIADILKCSQKEQISQFLCSMGSLRRKLNYGCMSEGELEVRRKWQELKCASYPWRQSDSPPVPPHLRGPWREDPQVVMVTKSNSITQKSSSCSF